MDFNWITPEIAVGGALPPAGAARLAEEFGIRRVIDVRAEMSDEREEFMQHGVELLTLPTFDFQVIDPAMLEDGIAWMKRALDEGEKVLVHCQLGIGRSVLLVCCYLVAQGRTAPEAMKLVKDARPQASPAPEQIAALIEWEEARHGRVSDWHDVAKIAYRHLDHWKHAQ